MRGLPMRKHLSLLLLLLLAVLLTTGFSSAEEENLLANSSFEETGADGLPFSWQTWSWFTDPGSTLFSTVEGTSHSGERCASIENFSDNDAFFRQTVPVEPEEMYRLSGWILARDIPGDNRWGANLSVEGLYVSTDPVSDTDGEWHYVELYGETGPDQTEVTVCVRVGGYSGECAGRALFDDLALVRVAEIPGDAVAALWFEPADWDLWEMDDTEEDTTADVVFPSSWKHLLVPIALAYMVLGILMLCTLTGQESAVVLEKKRRLPGWLWAGLAAALLIRLAVGWQIEGYPVDIGCFRAWGQHILSVGPSGFYSPDYFCDYPPVYMLVLGLLAGINNALQVSAALEVLILKLPAMLCDVAIAALIGRESLRAGRSRHTSAFLALFVAFNPLLILNSAAWGQVDSVLALLLLLVVIEAVHGQWRALMPTYVLAILVKPQALIVGFLGLAVIVMALIRNRTLWRDMLIGVGFAAALAAVILIPFGLDHHPGWLIDIYAQALSSYPHPTVNTANLYYLFGGNWQELNAAIAPGTGWILAGVSLLWGVWCLWANRKGERRLPWLESVLMGLFAVFFLLCEVLALDWTTMGTGAMALAFAVVLPLCVRSGNVKDLSFLGALLFLLMYTLGIKMHERYLFPALVFLAHALIHRRDSRLLLLLALLSGTMLINVGIPLDNALQLGPGMGHLNADDHTVSMVVALLNLAALPLALWVGADILSGRQEALSISLPRLFPVHITTGEGPQPHPDHRLHWKRIDTLLITAVTLCYAVLGLWNLGSTKAPQTAWVSSTPDEAVVLDLGKHYDDFSMLYYCGVSYRNFSVAVSEDGKSWSEEYWAQMTEGDCYHWLYLAPSYGDDTNRGFAYVKDYNGAQKLSGRYVRVSAQQVGLVLKEVIFRESIPQILHHERTETAAAYDETVFVRGADIPVQFVSRTGGNGNSPYYSDASLAVDEPGTCEGDPSWFNSTYFDEIYHARTAYEHLHGLATYETSHPPLGKLLMSVCIAIFGMTPFGWRLAGCLAGILMVPALYLTAKQLTKKTLPALVAAVMISLDCMHYTQTRIATIDSFPVLFIVLCFFFMLRFCQRDPADLQTRTAAFLPDLALSGFFMGLACASKWIGAYAGIGLAVLYFWTCGRALCSARRAEDKTLFPAVFRRVFHLCLWCLLFFVLIPAVTYILCYIPYFAYEKPESVGAFLRLVLNAQESMLRYHSQPGFGMDHPYYSPWYEWPLIRRPMYYYMAAFMPEGMSQSIFCFGNPAVWYAGLAGVLYVAWRWLIRHRWTADSKGPLWHFRSRDTGIGEAFLLIGLLAQFLPWVLVPRGTYIYHYFASVPFLILCVAWAFHRLGLRRPALARTAACVYLVICLLAFLLFFPYASGMPVPKAWLALGSKLLPLYYS